MELTHQELVLIDETRRQVKHWRRGILTDLELVHALVRRLVFSEADRIIPYCVGVIPEEARPKLADCVEGLSASGDRDRLLTFAIGSRAVREEAATPRFHAVAEAIRSFLDELNRRPAVLSEMAIPDEDPFWVHLRQRPTAGRPSCRCPGCGEISIDMSVLCARHYYESIKGRPPE